MQQGRAMVGSEVAWVTGALTAHQTVEQGEPYAVQVQAGGQVRERDQTHIAWGEAAQRDLAAAGLGRGYTVEGGKGALRIIQWGGERNIQGKQLTSVSGGHNIRTFVRSGRATSCSEVACQPARGEATSLTLLCLR